MAEGSVGGGLSGGGTMLSNGRRAAADWGTKIQKYTKALSLGT